MGTLTIPGPGQLVSAERWVSCHDSYYRRVSLPSTEFRSHVSGFQPIKVAVFGSCVTRDNFNRTFNPGYKDLFDCVALADHVSLVSLMSKPVHVDPSTLNGLEPRIYNNLLREFSRSYLAELEETQPEYLIVDFWPDLIFGFARLENGAVITNNAWSTMKTSFYNAQKVEVFKINHRTDEFMAAWTEALSRFMSFLERACPETRVIVHRSRNVGTWIDKTGATHEFSPWALSMNRHWDAMDDHLSSHFAVDSIDVIHDGLQSFEDHPWGRFPVHYTLNYHALFLARLARIALNDRSTRPFRTGRSNRPPRHRADTL
ncbi:DUF6270 domain-containing protein [Pseudarthrobacter enclensis]|uniref:DUF6270 domain-containing protein n=1 Tax=Pseudarthrobacter enclensis TaxID=993070 RepID=UPI0034380CC2